MKKISVIIVFLYFLLPSIVCQTNHQIKFAFVTDTHIGRENCAEDLRKIVTDINAQNDIDFTVITGDISNFGTDAELQEAKNILNKLTKNWYIFPGNHDTKWSKSGCSSFKKIFGEEHFSFQYGKYQFVGCGSGPEMRMGSGMVPCEEVAWLDSVVQSVSDRPLIYLNHYPINETLNNWYKIIDILKKGNPQAILCGHLHRNSKMDFEGIPATVGRSIIRDGNKNSGYNIVTIENDSIYFAERTPLIETHQVWIGFKLERMDKSKQYSRPSYQVNEQYPNVKEIWSIQDNCDIVSGIAADKNYCYYTDTEGYVKVLDIKTGNLAWKFKTGNKIFSTPAVAANKLVIASTDGNVYCLDSQTGRLIWKYGTPTPIFSSPVIDDNVVYIGSSEGKFRALSFTNGDIIWENNQISGAIETIPAIDKKHIYFGSWGSYFYALNKSDGKIVWKWTNGKNGFYSPAACIPVLGNDRVFIVDPERYTTALDAKTGEQIWHSNQCKGRESIGISEDKSLIYIKTMQDSLVAISTIGDKYEEKWVTDCQFGLELNPASPVEKNEIIFLPTDKGEVYAVDCKSHTIKWIRKLSNALVNIVLPLENHQLLSSTVDGKIVKLEYSKTNR